MVWWPFGHMDDDVRGNSVESLETAAYSDHRQFCQLAQRGMKIETMLSHHVLVIQVVELVRNCIKRGET